MPKVAKRRLKAEKAMQVAERLAKRGLSVVDEIVDLLEELRDVPKKESERNAMLYSDWEYTPDRKHLRLRARLRMDTLIELLNYTAPKLKAQDTSVDSGPQQVAVIIKPFEAEQPKAINISSTQLPSKPAS